MGLLDQQENETFSKFQADLGDAYLMPMLSQQAGFTTNWVGVVHPNGLYCFDAFRDGNGDDLKAACRRRSEEGFFNPVPVEVTAGGKVKNEDGMVVGEMTDYRNNPLDATVENDGNIEFVRENGGEYQLRRGNNNSHGTYLVKHFHEAMAAGDERALRALLHYVKFIYGEDVTVDYDEIDIEGETARTMFLVDKIYGRQSQIGAQTEEAESVAGVA